MPDLNKYIGKICNCSMPLQYLWNGRPDSNIDILPSNCWFVIIKIDVLTGVEAGYYDMYLLNNLGELRLTTLDRCQLDDIQIVTNQ